MIKTKLGELIKIQHGYAFKSENYVDCSQYRLITLGNFGEDNNFKYNDDKATYYGSEFPKEFILKEGDLIMPLTEQVIGLFGNTAFVPKAKDYTFVLNQRVGRIIVDSNKIDKYYLHYLLATQSVKKQIEARASGTRQRNVSPENIYDVEVYIPEDIATQKKIGELLYSIERKQMINDRINEELESIIKHIYNYWFNQFEFPTDNDKSYKKSGGKMIMNEIINKAIPENWKVENIINNSLCNIIKAGIDRFEERIYLPTANVENENIIDGNVITYENRESRANMQPKEYSVWFAKMKNSIKHISIPKNSDWFLKKYILSTGFEGIKCDEYSYAYIHSFIYSDYFEYHKNVLSHGATQEGVNDDDLKNVNLIIPDKNTLKKYSNIVNPLLEKKFENIRENKELSSIKNYLIPLLMNGQVTID